jgi:hypothetical protein
METGNPARPHLVAPLSLADRRIEQLARMELQRRRARSGGRAWINGREVGGVDARFAHLSRSYD